MIAVNSENLTIAATVTCPPAFPDWGTVETVICWWLVLLIMRILFKTVAGADFE